MRVLGYLTRMLLNSIKGLPRALGKALRQLTGIFLFILLAAMELGDWTGLMSRYSNPEKDAAALGITTQASLSHIMAMVVLSISIVLAAGITVLGLFQDSKWAIRSSQATGILYVLYGAYQLYAGIAVAHKGQEGLILAGVVYTVIGLAVFGLGNKFVQLPKPRQQQPSR